MLDLLFKDLGLDVGVGGVAVVGDVIPLTLERFERFGEVVLYEKVSDKIFYNLQSLNMLGHECLRLCLIGLLQSRIPGST